MPNNEEMDKQNLAYAHNGTSFGRLLMVFFSIKHNGILFNRKKKETLSHADTTEPTRASLEDSVLSEIGQSQKDKYSAALCA